MGNRLSLIPDLPEGFFYKPDFLSLDEETGLLQKFARLEFRPFDFHGYIARRRVIEYGWEYDFGTRQTSTAPEIPDFLLAIRDRAARFAETAAASLVEAVITEYSPGAPIGWHRDVPQFEMILGISLASACRMRLKPYKRTGAIVSTVLEPRSIYRMSGPARWAYQHSIPAVKTLRYSITFRTLRLNTKGKHAA